MFPDARVVAPVHKDGSFTLVSSGLKDHLEDKLYNSMRTGADFKKCIQEAFAMVRTEQAQAAAGNTASACPKNDGARDRRCCQKKPGELEIDRFTARQK